MRKTWEQLPHARATVTDCRSVSVTPRRPGLFRPHSDFTPPAQRLAVLCAPGSTEAAPAASFHLPQPQPVRSSSWQPRKRPRRKPLRRKSKARSGGVRGAGGSTGVERETTAPPDAERQLAVSDDITPPCTRQAGNTRQTHKARRGVTGFLSPSASHPYTSRKRRPRLGYSPPPSARVPSPTPTS